MLNPLTLALPRIRRMPTQKSATGRRADLRACLDGSRSCGRREPKPIIGLSKPGCFLLVSKGVLSGPIGIIRGLHKSFRKALYGCNGFDAFFLGLEGFCKGSTGCCDGLRLWRFSETRPTLFKLRCTSTYHLLSASFRAWCVGEPGSL